MTEPIKTIRVVTREEYEEEAGTSSQDAKARKTHKPKKSQEHETIRTIQTH